MRLGRNLVAGVGGSLWSALIGLAMVPFYLRYLGIEAYGLVGFFLGLQAVFQLLDLGLSPTISREVARAQALGDLAPARRLLRTLELFCWLVGVAAAAIIALSAAWIGSEWLSARQLSVTVIATAVALMGAVIGLRFPVGLYNGGLQGAHKLAEASVINAAMATLAAVGAVVVLQISPRIEAYFGWQLVVAGCHVALARRAAWHALGGREKTALDLDRVRQIWRFSAGMGIVTILGTVLLQLDKIVLSQAVSLEAFGSYTLAGMGARALALLTTPVFGVIYPRLAAMVATGDQTGIRMTYRVGTRLLLALLMPLAVFVAAFAVELFTIWTDEPGLARAIELPVIFLVIGTALNAVMIVPYALQLAHGRSRLAAEIAGILILGFVPLLLWLVPQYGITGGALAWAALNLAYIPLGTVLTHRAMLRGTGLVWLIEDVAVPCGIAAMIVGGGSVALHGLELSPVTRLGLGALLVPLASLAILATSLPIRRELARRARSLAAIEPRPREALARLDGNGPALPPAHGLAKPSDATISRNNFQ